VEGYNFQTTKPRARAPHLLREHQLLFESHGRAPIPLPVTELNERLAALKKRQRGSRERRRDAAKAAAEAAEVGGTSSTQSPPGQVAGSPTAAASASTVRVGRDCADASLPDLESEDES